MTDILTDCRVALIREKPSYAATPPYHPSARYPEWPDLPVSSEVNPAYQALRLLFYHLGLDRNRFDTGAWNPLEGIIKPGGTVVIKPNLVHHRNLGEYVYGVKDTDCLVTHGSVIRAVLDYTAKALEGHGKIIIGDCPIQGADWQQIIRLVGLDKIEDFFSRTFPGIRLIIKDYRLGRAVVKDGIVINRLIDESEVEDYEELDLKRYSALIPLMKEKYEFGVAQYPKHRLKAAHSPESNKYLIHKDFLYCDAIINLPKMKAHMKAGITCSLKNFVGLVGHKDYLPHFRFGSPKNGGDEYPDGNWFWDLMWFFTHLEWSLDNGILKRLLNYAVGICSYLLPTLSGMPRSASGVGGGSWHGNDTLWRTILDINRVFFYADRKSGEVKPDLSGEVKYLAILDGLVAGHKESPLSPAPLPSGVMLGGFNPLAVDTVAAAIMGFDHKKVKHVREGFSLKSLPLANFNYNDILLCGNTGLKTIDDIYQQKAYTSFEPAEGFKGFLEIS